MSSEDSYFWRIYAIHKYIKSLQTIVFHTRISRIIIIIIVRKYFIFIVWKDRLLTDSASTLTNEISPKKSKQIKRY